MKRIQIWRVCLLCILAAALAGILAGCGSGTRWQDVPEQASSGEDARLNVVTTLFPYYDFTRQITGGDVDLTLVVPAGMDSHSFEPTPADMRTIQNADILIRNGGEMEHWLDEVLDALDTSHMTVVTMMDYVDTVEEDIVEGMEDADHEGHNHAEEDYGHNTGLASGQKDYVDYDGHEAGIEYDEHIWTSPVNAMKLVAAIRDTLAEQDAIHAGGAHADSYRQRAMDYLAKLKTIDEGFREVSDARRRNLIVVGDKFPFRYLADEYQLDYRAAFSGCSSDTEPSAKTIAYLVDKVKAEGIPVVYYLELSSHRVAEIIGEETGATPLLLHSCHNVTRAQFDAGVTYAELMEQNIENLRKGIDE